MTIKDKFKESDLILKVYTKFKSLLTIISPTLSTKVMFRISRGKNLNLKNPITLDEKILWLKLNSYYKNPLISQCADKYLVREYIKSCDCEEILNELYHVYDNVDEIKWESLPEKFALKWNMGCGCNIICSDKSILNIEEAKKKLVKWGRTKYHLSHAEMQYKYIEPKIVCEKFLETNTGEFPEDYKFYCFNGEAKYVMVCVGRSTMNPKFYYFDKEWNMLPLSKDALDAPEGFSIPKPIGIEKMFEYANKISKPFPFVRADFYLMNGKTIFGELTFTPSGGIDSSRLPKTDKMLGDLVLLPN